MHNFSQSYIPFLPASLFVFAPFFIILVVWTIVIKGYALWHAARNGQKEWFVALLVLNTVGILEIIYLLWFRSESKNADLPLPVAPNQPSQE